MTRRDGDYMKEIVEYIESNLKSGYREDQLRFLLINQGYSRSAVDKAFRIVEQNRPAEPVRSNAEPPKVEFVEEELPQKKEGFFSKLFGGLFSSKKKPESLNSNSSSSSNQETLPQNNDSAGEFVQIDSEGNLVK